MYSILAVDDEKSNLVVLNQILSTEYFVYMAKSGVQALRLVAKNRPDLILLDIIMPEMDGFEVLAKLKESPATREIPVIIITGLNAPNDEEKGFTLGANDFLTKPFKPAVIKARVDMQIKCAALMHMIADDLTRVTSIVESSPNFMIYLGGDGKIEYMNPATVTQSGYTKEELARSGGLALLLGTDGFRRLHEEYLPRLLSQSSSGKYGDDKVSMSFEMLVTRKDGEIRSFSFTAFATVLHSGEAGIGITAQDDTELKQIQQKLVAAKEQAEHALVQAKYYSKAKSDLLSRMSHEMRTPLNAIMGMTAIAKTTHDSNRTVDCLETIEEASQRLLELVNNILDMAEIDTGDFKLVTQRFSFNTTIGRIITDFFAKAARNKQVFSFTIDPLIPDLIIADERRLEQVLSQLLSNALKFTSWGGAIGFSATRLDRTEDECRIRFEITDTGAGISREMQRRLGDAFEQMDNSITRTHGGMGLGLAISKRIVQLMNGSIEVESELGKGSRFICTVRVVVDNGASLEKKERKEKRVAGASPLARRRILVADDVEINRDIIYGLLEDTGVILESARDGNEAVAMATENRYDIVLMDLHMPGMDGIEATSRIRTSGLPGRDTLPIIAVTADIGGNAMSRCRKAGMNGFIAKPLDSSILIRSIVENLERKP